MWSTTEVADAAQRDGDRKGVTGPYIPSFSANERLEDGNREMEEAVWALGEVRFGNVESADGPTHPFPILGVVAESTDELTTPPPTVIQLERNQPDLSPDWTDEKRTPASAELMETAELNVDSVRVRPLVDCQLDTVEDHLHPATGSTSQDTGSSDIQAMRNLPDKSTGNRNIQETGSLESLTVERPEAAIIASSAQRATAHVMIYPNSGSVNPFIIIENKTQHLPVMNSDATEAPGSLEQGDREATVTTDIAGAEHVTRTGCRYTQISRTHVEPVSEEVEDTSREDASAAHEALFPDTSEEDPDNQDSFTKLLAELNLEIEEEVDIELDGELEYEGSRLCPTPVEEAEMFRMAKEWDVRIDHPTSATGSIECSKGVQPTKFSQDTQEVPDCVAELKPEELKVDYGMSNSDDANQEKPSTLEEAEVELANGNERAADCCTHEADFSESNMDFRKSDTHVRHMAGPGSAEPDEDYGASDVDTTGSRKSMGLGKSKEEKVQRGRDINKVSSFNKHVKKANVRFHSGRGVKQKLIPEINPPTGSRGDVKKSTKLPKAIRVTARDILESLRLFDQGFQRDSSAEEDLHGLCIVDLDAEIDFRKTVVISGGSSDDPEPINA